MDSQLRTRLIGAAVLIGLAVIFLPMVLDKDTTETPVPNEEISLDIPVPGSEQADLDGLQTRTLPINEQAPMVEFLLFSKSKASSKDKTELMLAITPRLVRGIPVPLPGLASFGSALFGPALFGMKP